MKNDSLKTYTIIAVVVLVAMAAVASFLLLSIFDKNNQANTYAGLIQEENIKEAKLKGIKTTVSETSDSREEVDKYFIKPDGEVEFIELIENLSTYGSELEITSVKSEDYGEGDKFEWIVVSVRASGAWQEVIDTLALIENLPFRTDIEDVSLEESQVEGVSVWNLRALIKTLKIKKDAF